MVKDCIKFADPVKVPLLYLEKNTELLNLADYFQSEEYLKETDMLLK